MRKAQSLSIFAGTSYNYRHILLPMALSAINSHFAHKTSNKYRLCFPQKVTVATDCVCETCYCHSWSQKINIVIDELHRICESLWITRLYALLHTQLTISSAWRFRFSHESLVCRVLKHAHGLALRFVFLWCGTCMVIVSYMVICKSANMNWSARCEIDNSTSHVKSLFSCICISKCTS